MNINVPKLKMLMVLSQVRFPMTAGQIADRMGPLKGGRGIDGIRKRGQSLYMMGLVDKTYPYDIDTPFFQITAKGRKELVKLGALRP